MLFLSHLKNYSTKKTKFQISSATLLLLMFFWAVSFHWEKQSVSAANGLVEASGKAVAVSVASTNHKATVASETPKISEAFAKLPLAFEENRGQASKTADFIARGAGYSIALSSTETVLTLGKDQAKSGSVVGREEKAMLASQREGQERLSLKFLGANAKAVRAGLEELPGKSNYLIGNDSTKWRTNVLNFAKVKYSNVYPGVDAFFYGNQQSLEYDFVVAPGIDPEKIELQYSGHQNLQITSDGDLLLQLEKQQSKQSKPIAYQEINGQREAVDCRYRLTKKGTIKFEVANYDSRKPLIIDPTIIYSSGMFGELARMKVGTDGSIYIAGWVVPSSNFTTTGPPFQASFGGGSTDTYVQKLNAAGNAIVYSTYLGGNDEEWLEGLHVDASSQVYVAGRTYSTNFPTANAYQASHAGTPPNWDAFISKLNAAGNGLVYSTYLGGAGDDKGNGLAVDTSGKAYLIGTTTSAYFPLLNPLPSQNTLNANGSVFITSLNATGSTLAYSTYFGGSDSDDASAIAVDSAGNCYFAGQTTSTNLPVVNASQTTFNNSSGLNYIQDGFYGKLNATGTALTYLSYLGGEDWDSVNAIAVDSTGAAYLTGYTTSSSFPTTAGAYQKTKPVNLLGDSGKSAGLATPPTSHYKEAFVTKISPSGGASLAYSTYLGGNREDEGAAIALDANNNICIGGSTTSYWVANGSPGFPRANATQTNYYFNSAGTTDAFFNDAE